METLKYKIIKNDKQYLKYCFELEVICSLKKKTKIQEDEIELLTFLIEKYDEQHIENLNVDPIQLLKKLLHERNIKSNELATILKVSKGLVSDILNYKKGLSKEIIRKLADDFKVNQAAFNRPYKLISPLNNHLRNASVMNTEKELLGV